MLKLIANVESFGTDHYTACIESIKGMVVEGNSVEEVCKELLISLRVKLAYDLGIDIDHIEETSTSRDEMILNIKDIKFSPEGKAKKEISLNLV